MPHLRTLLIALLLLITAQCAQAQPAVERARQTLQDIQGFYLTVDVEGTRGLTQEPLLDVATIRRRVAERLTAAGLHIIEATEMVEGERVPNLYVHINMLDAGEGIVPFAVNTQFFQQVQLAEQRIAAVASTWDTGLVGVVSYDTLELIGDTAVTSVTNFIDDYIAVNR
ncbi:MAG: hypothetical protein R2834_22740 [Rhodothermales bacterium]